MNKLIIFAVAFLALFAVAQAGEAKSLKELMGEISTGAQLEDSNGLVDCIKTVSGLFPTLGDAATAFLKHDSKTDSKLIADIYKVVAAASSLEADCAGLV